MKYHVEPRFSHASAPATGVLLVNLGTPDEPRRGAVRRYLAEFLWDPRVVEMSRPLWWLVLNGIILNTRPARSARAYASVWGENGSPLLVHSRQQRDALERRLSGQGAPPRVALAMRYGSPSIAGAIDQLRSEGVSKLLVLPLYPQYSATTTASVFDAVADALRRMRRIPALRMIDSYHDHPAYIDALAASVREFQAEHGVPDRLLMSFHGIPREYFDAGDPYFCHCQKTARLLAERLGLSTRDYAVTFQSRLGPREWLRPYTDETVRSLPAEGVRHVQVICPGFSADCLETLEEISVENRDYFLQAGGERFEYIPCLNARDDHVQMMQTLVAEHMAGWESRHDDPAGVSERARALGARE